MRGLLIGLVLLLLTVAAQAQQPAGDMSAYLPDKNALAGWELSDPPRMFRGEELFRMINGGADVFHEYGFKQTLEAKYIDPDEKLIKLEIYEMKSPAAAYGAYTFRTGDEGKAATVGQEALLEDYYLNFWKGNFLVTVVGPDPGEKTVQSIVALAKAVDACLPKTGARPELAELFLGSPLDFSNLTYIRGPLGLMSKYIFDTKNIFRISEGVIGVVEGCRAFVFRYADQDKGKEVFGQAVAALKAGTRFTDQALAGDQYSMVDRKGNSILINRAEEYITVVIGPDRKKIDSISTKLIEKIKAG